MHANRLRPGTRALAAAGALLAGVAVGLAAYAAHGVAPAAQPRLLLAAVFAFGHGVALAALAPHARSRGARLALALLLAGVLLFSGSLVAAVLAGATTALAPAGGLLMIAGWLLHAVASLRDQGEN